MKKEIFVTAGLCRIKDQIAEAARISAETGAEQPKENTQSLQPVSIFSTLPEETRKALRTRCQEYEHSRRDLLFRLHELSATVSRQETEARKNAEMLQSVKSNLDSLQQQLDRQQEPDEFSADFQIRLAENFRELDHMRIELIQLQSEVPEKPLPESRRESNLFAELDSVSFSQIFRIGAALYMPMILMILFSTAAIAMAIVLTFRFGL